MTAPQHDLDLRRAAGQLLLVGFHGDQAPPAAITDALRQSALGGVILFKRNIQPGPAGLQTLAAMNQALWEAAPEGGPWPFVAVDQEGGRVMRVRDGVTPIPPMHQVAAAQSREHVARVGEVLAEELALLGFNLNFAPVLDVFTNPHNTVIGDRAFGDDPERVAELAGALCVGHYMAGVAPCGKHFPGHGDTDLDSHFDLPVVLHDPERLRAVELVPFARAIRARIPMIMTAHILAPALDALHPVTLSPRALRGILRDELGFEGVIISDDLEMKAVADRYSIEEMISLGLDAGVDIFLICHTEDLWRRAYDHLLLLAQNDPQARERIFESAQRVVSLKQRLLARTRYTAPQDVHTLVGTPEHIARVTPPGA